METISSADGTTIAFDRTGTGPAVIVVVGAFCDRQSKKKLSAALADRFTVFEYDRRGRGDSGPLIDDSVEREIEDFAALVTKTGDTPFVFGDSSGGAIAIDAAAAGVDVRKVAVYEVPFTDGPTLAFADGLAKLVSSGDLGEAVAQFLKLMGTPVDIVDSMKRGPYWSQMEAFAATLPVDVRLCNDGRVPEERLAKVTVPLMAMAGSVGPWAVEVANALAVAAPQGEVRVLEGYGHDVPEQVLVPVLESFFD